MTAANTTDYSARFSDAANQQYRVDSNGQNITLANDLTSAGGSFTKLGPGTITLSGSNTFASGSAAAGVLQGSAINLATTGTFGVASGAEVRFNQTAPNQTWDGAMAGSGTFSKYGTGTLTLTGSTSASATTGTLLIAEGAVKGTTDSIRRNVVNNSQLTFDQTFSGTYSRAISGTGNVLLSNTGTITWTGTNTYTGTTTVAGGRLIGNTNNIVGDVVNNSAVQFNQTTNGTYAGNMSGSGPLAKNNNGTLTLTGSNSYQGGTFVNAGSLIGDTGSLQGSIAVASGTLGFDQATSGTFSGLLLGTSVNSRFVKTGVGDLTLSGTNTNDGTWTVSGGRLIGTTSSLQGAITNNAAVTFDQVTDGTYAGAMTGSGSLTKSGAGAVTLSGTNSYGGGTTVSAGSLIGTTSSLQGAITNNAAVTFDQATGGTYSGAMTGSGSLTKSGNGAVTLSGTSSYGGGTTVSAGSLIGTTSSLQGAITNNAAVTFDQVTDGTYSGAMTGSGSLTKLGLGAVTFTGTSSYAGATTVSEGSLLVNGRLTNSSVIVNNGATLGGSGTIDSLVTVLAGGTIAPGNSPGLLSVGSLDLQNSSTTLMQIVGSAGGAGIAGIDYDKIVVATAGGLGYGGNLALDFANLTNFADGTVFDLFGFTGGPTGGFGAVFSRGIGSYAGLTFSGLSGIWTSTAGGQTLTFTESTGRLVFSGGSPPPPPPPAPVPELDPGSFGGVIALVAGAFGLLERRVRRKRS